MKSKNIKFLLSYLKFIISEHMINKLKLTLLFTLLVSALFGQEQQIEFRPFGVPGTAVKGIQNNGNALLATFTYDYVSNMMVPKPAEINTYAYMNEAGDIVGTKIIDGLTHPIYKLANSEVWITIPVFESFVASDVTTVYKISENGRYISGQMQAKPFVYDIQTQTLTNLLPQGYTYGAGYSVNNSGKTVGWVDANTNGTFRELAVYQVGQSLEKILTDLAVPVNNHIWHITDEGTLVGDVALKPYIYNLNTNEYKVFNLPAGYRTGAFVYSSNGITVGYAQNNVMDRDAIIYHESFGDQPRLLKEILIEEGITIDIPGGRLGGANSVSENGNFIGGNESGNANIAPGWIINLNGYFDEIGCIVEVPADIEYQTEVGQNSAVITYDVTTNCEGATLQLVEGFESGAEFPLGITTVKYNSVDAEGNILATGTFKVNVKDAYCTPRFSVQVEPITNVTFGTINNTTSADLTSAESEYFLNMSTDIAQNGSYEITVAGNTNGPENGSEFVVFFDFNQDGTFDSDTEGFYIGSISNSTGVDGKTVSNTITIPENALLGETRMRVMKVYRIVPEDACSLTYAYGQSENYKVNITAPLAVTDVVNSSVKVYPNPVKDILKIETAKEIISIKVLNTLSQQVGGFKVDKTNSEVNFSGLSKGVYFIQIVTSDETIIKKVIKK
ncbi:T9SS C-terminal target domain-containing protein [Faecalibacter macacae]|uniref:T9SS C-terminal target domain-containing protein n=2 Tax=Faecalibacter macacae TaxID=1859289 RepID=A0A3L9M9N0_9FLAO|nr:T9SS C-terminal target domain-containing protein [Faecalibacter macacae]